LILATKILVNNLTIGRQNSCIFTRNRKGLPFEAHLERDTEIQGFLKILALNLQNHNQNIFFCKTVMGAGKSNLSKYLKHGGVIMKVLGKVLILLFVWVFVAHASVLAADKGNFSTAPKTNNGEKWRVGYYEGGEYID